MVNTGRPSRGCLTCRRRRIKCDETRPDCKRCVKLNVDCEWRDEWSTVIRPQESWAKKTVAQRVERVQNRRNEQQERELLLNHPSTVLPSSDGMVGLQVRPELYAIERFYQDYGFRANTVNFLNFVEPYYGSQAISQCINSVLPAVALVNVAKQQRRHDLMQEARRHYGRALRSMTEILKDPVARKHDATLVTVYLMALYEVICFDREPGQISPLQSHGKGRLAILRLRGPEQLDTQAGRNLFIVIYSEQLNGSLFHRNGQVLDEAPTWLRDRFPVSPIVNQIMLMHDVSVYLKKLDDLLRARKKDRLQISETFAQGLEFAAELSKQNRLRAEGATSKDADLKQYAPRVFRQARHRTRPSESRKAKPKSPHTSKTPKPRMQGPGDDTANKETTPREVPSSSPTVRSQPPEPSAAQQPPRDVQLRTIPIKKEREDYGPHPANAAPARNQNPTYPLLNLVQQDVSSITGKRREETDPQVATYFSITWSILGNLCRATEIYLLQALLEALPFLDAKQCDALHIDPERLRTEWDASIATRAVQIYEHVPYGLGEVDSSGNRFPIRLTGTLYRAYMQLCCMQAALAAPQTPRKYRIRLAKRLDSISKEMGIGLAGELLAALEDAEALLKTEEAKAGEEDEDPSLKLNEKMFYIGMYIDDKKKVPLFVSEAFTR
ncbi:hypothetical protein BU24DRAFT_454859 [Aaosphaeria arxii CBS 175.79]|uniref:Zn(2)-C6 fungal-type domain-containing protein n=1 Tax=Aaosphaeria arxii CBS 175.79 TaxID=1450172 RepID=A0A6A5XC15_9PLEO|nr:uncharacterized protein BU24DRAFT_454859 [Aaosphaeria arxii CBS 175.79]KAF2010498.1 hypothetical protein BU24DRAFT_454859 [Aaosphaeria arxii CBS 175.79]